MKRRKFLKMTGIAAASMALPRFTFSMKANLVTERRSPERSGQPNIVVILSDDQGYGDVSAYKGAANHIHTPNTDRLARQGVLLTNGYASAPVCAPTRAGWITGRYQQRFGFYTAGDSRSGMPTNEITVADLLKDAGYATGVFGKWHLGLEPQHNPVERGFDEFFGFLGHGGHHYFKLNSKPTDEKFLKNAIYRNDKPIEKDRTGYLTDILTDEAVSFIERHRERPFFLYLPYNAPHKPLQAPKEYLKRFDTGNKDVDTYLAMLACMDDGIGRVMDALEHTGVADNTLFFFYSDNGGVDRWASMGPLRGGKHTLYEGGIRIPFIVRWPGHLPSGEVCSEPIICQDIFTTALTAAGVKPPRDRIIDGKNMLPALRGENTKPLHKNLFWSWAKPGRPEEWSIRHGRWKLLRSRQGVELYDLEDDIGETKNLARQDPERLQNLLKTFKQWRGQLPPPLWVKRKNVKDWKRNMAPPVGPEISR